jgi:tetratricopeptide (TPR) repeat protein
MTATAATEAGREPDRLAEIEGLRRRGRLGDAMAACQDLLQQSPEDARLLLLAAAISRDGRHHIRAASYLERVLAAEPPRASIYGEAARIWRQCGNKAGAVDAYRNALRLDPAWAPAHIELAEIQSEDGHVDEAVYHLKIAIAVDPDKLDARERLAALLEGAERECRRRRCAGKRCGARGGKSDRTIPAFARRRCRLHRERCSGTGCPGRTRC